LKENAIRSTAVRIKMGTPFTLYSSNISMLNLLSVWHVACRLYLKQ